jgi:hypothetical protein
MNEEKITEIMDHIRWTLNNGIVTDIVKNNLYMYGSLAHKDVKALEVAIDPSTKTVDYKIYGPKSMLDVITRYYSMRDRNGIFDLWRLKRLLKKQGNLDIDRILNAFVKDLCGPGWRATYQLKNISEYVEEPNESETERDKK